MIVGNLSAGEAQIEHPSRPTAQIGLNAEVTTGRRVETLPCSEFYSVLSARIGSVDAARRAGTIAAIVAASKSSSTLPPTASGSMTGV